MALKTVSNSQTTVYVNLQNQEQTQENVLAVTFHNTLTSIALQMNTMHKTFKDACDETQREVKELFDGGAEKLKNAKSPQEYKEWVEVIKTSKELTNAPLEQISKALEQAKNLNIEAQTQNNTLVTKALSARASLIETNVKAEIQRMVAETNKHAEMQKMAQAKQEADLKRIEFENNQNRMTEQQKMDNLNVQLKALTEAYNAELSIAQDILAKKGKNFEIKTKPPRIDYGNNTVISGTVEAESSNCVMM